MNDPIVMSENEMSEKVAETIPSLGIAQKIITEKYLSELQSYEVVDIPVELKELNIVDFVRLYKFKKVVASKSESFIDKFVTVLNAAYSSQASVVTIICGYKDETEYYIGVVNKKGNDYDVCTQGEVLEGVLRGNFPGIEIAKLRDTQVGGLLNKIFNSGSVNVTSVSGIASVRNENEKSYEKFVQGIEHLSDALQGREYNILVIADPVVQDDLGKMRYGYEELYSELSAFHKISFGYNKSQSLTLTTSQTNGVTKTIGESTALTQSYSVTNGWSESFTENKSVTKSKAGAIGMIIGAGLGIAATIATGGAAAPLAAMAVGAGAGAGGAAGSFLGGTKTEGTSVTSGTNKSYTSQSGKTTTKQESTAVQESKTNSEAEGETKGKTLTVSTENKVVGDLLRQIDDNLERIQKCEAFGAFCCATYVISNDLQTNTIVSSEFNALMRGDKSSLKTSHINTWSDNGCGNNGKKGKSVREYLEKLSHPLFKNNSGEGIYYSPGSIVNSYELAINMGLPKKSVPGLPVYEIAPFGRNIPNTNSVGICLGQLYHMGRVEIGECKVNLDIDKFASHLFVTGSTGSGKSNTVYQLLNSLTKSIEGKDSIAKRDDVHFLVIEPAKGEYKDVFSNRKDVNVYGTNPKLTPLLRINPFSFDSKNIHVYEHMDRLVEIFNVCWPMYAAMPAVLKNAIEKAYEDCGWNLVTSFNEFGKDLFPNFADVARNVKFVIESSEYDAENKGAYKGALLTRLQSLTNGINGLIFCDEEIAAEDLFEKNVIVDLSRVGSQETKSLLMGMLVLKLQEYRMTQDKGNVALKHVTVLEEAHNLLKRSTVNATAESGNLAGKSVEMIANAIAEMRTYGEGFIIVDQAPGLLDMTTIRNTNTKIIMRLPDQSDRELVGKAANLNDDQIVELAKLPCGVAAVYQNEWIEPVLCKVGEFEYDKNRKYKKQEENVFVYDVSVEERLKIAELLSKGICITCDARLEELRIELKKWGLASALQVMAIKMLRNPPKEPRMTKLAPIMHSLFPKLTEKLRNSYADARKSKEWTDAVENELRIELNNQVIDEVVRRDIVQGIITNYLLNVVNNPLALKDWHEKGGLA